MQYNAVEKVKYGGYQDKEVKKQEEVYVKHSGRIWQRCDKQHTS
jgi:hypothetical protein